MPYPTHKHQQRMDEELLLVGRRKEEEYCSKD
jgi:hypothetical protein